MTADNFPKAVLVVTGAWLLPEHYRKAIERLEAEGVRAICACLISNDGAATANATLADDVALIREVAASEVAKGTQMTVPTHSYSGVVLSVALADLAASKSGVDKVGVVNIISMASGEHPVQQGCVEDDTRQLSDM